MAHVVNGVGNEDGSVLARDDEGTFSHESSRVGLASTAAGSGSDSELPKAAASGARGNERNICIRRDVPTGASSAL